MSDAHFAPGALRRLIAGSLIALLACGAMLAERAAAEEAEPSLGALLRLEEALTTAEKADLQRVLATLGYYGGPIDALFGGGTREAIRRYQASIGAPETGWLTAGQMDDLMAGSAAALTAGGADGAGDTVTTAADLGRLETVLTATDRVALGDRDDLYRFRLDRAERVTLAMTLAAGDADLALLDAGGALIAVSDRQSRAAETIEAALDPGDYTVQVSYFEGTAPYDLAIRASGPPATAAADLMARETAWSRAERRRVERGLQLLGYLTDGVDGYFGGRTRDAIRGFQLAAGEPATGYLTTAQRVRLAVGAAEAAAAAGRETAEAAVARAAAARSIADRAPPSGFEGYRGEMRDGRRVGLGVFAPDGGSRYEGEFADDRRHGLGVAHEADGDRYEGEFVDANPSGFGSFTKPDGRAWHGEFVDGPLDGFGVFIGTDGFRAAGEWRRDDGGGWSFSGFGEQGRTGETPRRGRWERSELVEPL